MSLLSYLIKFRDRLVNLRSFERAPDNEKATLSLFKAIGNADSVEVLCRDISEAGMGILSDHPFWPGSVVRVATRGRTLWAEVRRCTKADHQYLVGLQFTGRPSIPLVRQMSKMDLDLEGINYS